MAPPRSSRKPPSRTAQYGWVTAPCDPAFKSRVNSLARRLGRSTSSVVRSALLSYVEDHEAGRKNDRRPIVLLDFDYPATGRKVGRR